MSRYIDIEPFIKVLEDAKRSAYEHWDIDTANAFEEVINLVMNIPIIEAEPIKHGKPVVYYHGENSFSYECGVCRMPIDGTDYYCRWCGARMDEVTE